MASLAIASSLLVVLPIAETTTTGRRATRALTIEATRSMADADSTDVPPNFITIMVSLPSRLLSSSSPSVTISSAFSTAAPAAPRTVLCPMATNL